MEGGGWSLPPMAVRSGVGGKEVVVAVEMLADGEAVFEARTILASRSALSFHRSTCSTKKLPLTLSASTSFPCISWMSRRTQGGGVIGLRSLSPKPHIRAL